MNIIDIYPDTANGISAHSYFKSLSFPPILSIDQLLGKSNFKSWRSSIEPVLLANPLSSKLILGDWPDPSSRDSRAASSVFASASAFDDPNPTIGVGVGGGVAQKIEREQQERTEWHRANTATCRFIRATLALNVAPFVRQHNTAKALYLNIIWLYGDEAGIDTQGGPPVPAGARPQNMQQMARAGLLAALESSSNSSMIMPFPSQAAAATGGRLSLSLSQNAVSSNNSSTSTLSMLAGPASSPASASRSVLDVSRPDSQVLPATQTTPLVIVPPPPAVVHIYERTRQSPDPSLDTIHEHEKPHPGRRVSFGHRARSCTRSRSRNRADAGSGNGSDSDNEGDTSTISPLSLSEMSVEDDDDDDSDVVDLSPINDVQGHTGQADKYRTSNMNKNQEIPYNNGQSGSSKSKSSIFGRNFGRDQASTKTRKLSFSFPLRRLHKDKDKDKDKEKSK
ncbi:hypothetical protein LTR20_004275 [Exophiala xenobiotica]|nr:hypothetical protein LTR40_009665 [Exophiala xenobiotica]KAK5360195.1 hypothetical protein LTS13_010285 [Exophiala xenobiotica]KAK5398841.1 hypothetical protein LTR79_003839 [Exophiala xenobiotica]KAK5421493.1 hypothetical protein LTR90_002983 [Exophiala xenobiotica]KAK5465857.1 hypothetical protein LTR20_004275 [Exophiala xenobiotica]